MYSVKLQQPQNGDERVNGDHVYTVMLHLLLPLQGNTPSEQNRQSLNG